MDWRVTDNTEGDSLNCLVVGHFDQRLEELASRLKPTREHSGGYSVLRTNSILTDGGHLSYAEVFNQLAMGASGRYTNFNPFDAPHAGVTYLVDFLRRNGVNALGLRYVSASLAELVDALELYSPTIVVLTTTFYVTPAPLQELVACIRRHAPNATVVVGGPYVVSTALGPHPPAQRLRQLGADVCILDGQGERTLLELVTALAGPDRSRLAEVSNLTIYGEGDIVTETQRVPEQNDQLPVRWKEFTSDLTPPLAFVRTARGCPFRCAFCNYPAMAGGKHDVMSVDSVCAELETLVETGVRDVAFVDDTFNVPLPRFKRLLRELIARDLRLRWTSFFRCSNADRECFDLMAEAGCQAVFLGIESGDPDVLKAMNKAAKPESYAQGIAAMRERGILTMASYVMGFPGETSESIARTLQFIEENPTTFFNVQLYYHDLLAPVERRRSEFGIEGSAYSWSHRTMDWVEAADWVELAMQLRTAPIPLPLYGFSIWSLPYFMSNGFSREKFVTFSQLAGDLFQSSLAGGDAGACTDDFVGRFGEMFSAEELDRSLLASAGAVP